MQNDPSHQNWIGSLVTLLGVGGLGAGLLKLIERLFTRADKHDDDAVKFRSELRAEITDLNARNDALVERLDAANERAHAALAEAVELRAENLALRNRYHRLTGYVTEALLVQEHYADRLNIPQHERLRIPAWVDETIPGPTASAALPSMFPSLPSASPHPPEE